MKIKLKIARGIKERSSWKVERRRLRSGG